MLRIVRALLAITCTISFLVGCSSSGGGITPSGGSTPVVYTISGVAAGGAPIIGTVYIKDSKGTEKSVAVSATANGAYSIDVSGMTAPFVMKAVGTIGGSQVTYCSAATSDDFGKTINITPFTDLMVASIAGQVAANYYSNGDPSKITTQALTQQVQSLTNKLAPVMQAMGISSSTDLLRASFTPGSSGLDKMMDIVKVAVNPTTTAVTITNILDNSQLTATSLSSMGSAGLSGTISAPTTSQISDIDQISQGIQNFAAQFKTAMPSPTSTALTTLIGSNFMDDGRNRDNFLNEMTAKGDALGFTAGPASFISTTVDSSKNITAAVVQFVVTLPKMNNQTQTITWQFSKANGTWQALGNGRIVKFDFHATAYYVQSSPNTNNNTHGTGLEFYIIDTYNNAPTVATAVVTGPGLPAAGLILYNIQANTSSGAAQYTIDKTGQNTNDVYWLSQSSSATTDQSILSTFAGANDANIPYTVTLYDASQKQVAQYTINISKRHYTYAELAQAPFATLTQPKTYSDLASFKLGVANTITWTLAAGTISDWLNVNVSGTDSNGKPVSVNYNGSSLLPAQTSLTVTLGAGTLVTPTNANVTLSVDDQYGRILNTQVGTF